MSKPVALLDPQWRRLDELFAQSDLDELGRLCDLVWAKQEPMPESLRREALNNATFYLSSLPIVDAAQLDSATNLRAVIELYGAFPDTVDYPACFARGVDVLATGPGMRRSVAEMAVAMALSGARGLVQEHELFRLGKEHWLNDNPQTDFSLYGQSIGFVGFGSIAKECCRLLAPFEPSVSVYDPWLDAKVADEFGTKMVGLEELAQTSRCFFVTAAPTKTNKGCRVQGDHRCAASRSPFSACEPGLSYRLRCAGRCGGRRPNPRSDRRLPFGAATGKPSAEKHAKRDPVAASGRRGVRRPPADGTAGPRGYQADDCGQGAGEPSAGAA